MFKIKFQKKIKKAQHIVEFAILLPFFIIIFSFIFPLMAETYAHFNFSYFLINLVSNTIEGQLPLESKNDAAMYDFRDEMIHGLTANPPNLFIIYAKQTAFITGYSNMPITTLFGVIGKNYFFFSVPVNNAYLKPTVLNVTTEQLNDTFTDDFYRGEG